MAASTWRRAVLEILELLVLAQSGEPPTCFCRKSRWPAWSFLFNELPGLQSPEHIFVVVRVCLQAKPGGAFSTGILAVASQNSGWVSFLEADRRALFHRCCHSPE